MSKMIRLGVRAGRVRSMGLGVRAGRVRSMGLGVRAGRVRSMGLYSHRSLVPFTCGLDENAFIIIID